MQQELGYTFLSVRIAGHHLAAVRIHWHSCFTYFVLEKETLLQWYFLQLGRNMSLADCDSILVATAGDLVHNPKVPSFTSSELYCYQGMIVIWKTIHRIRPR